MDKQTKRALEVSETLRMLIKSENENYIRISVFINKYNFQIDKINILCKDDEYLSFKTIANIMQFVENFTIEDNYGDIVNSTFRHNTYYMMKGNDNVFNNYTFKFDIDS